MSDSLFRQEAVEARRRSWLGEISLAQPVSVRVLAAFAVTAVALIVAFLTVGEYTRRSRVAGQLVPDRGLVTIVAPVDGTIARPLPAEGERVEHGRPLVVLTTSRASASTGDMTADLLARLEERRAAAIERFAAVARLLEAQQRGSKSQLAAARRELEQIETSISLGKERLRIAEELRAHLGELARRHYVSRLQLAQQEQAALGQAVALQALEQEATSVQRDILGLEQRLRELSMQHAERQAAHTAELAALEEERLRIAASGSAIVPAPLDGLVASTIAEPGQAVRAGQPVLSLVPAGSVLQAQLLVPSRAVGFIDKGDAVLLRYQAFPHQKFGHHRGTVLSVSRNALDTAAVAALTGSLHSAEPFYRVLVMLPKQHIDAYGRQEALRPGMLVEADILGERRKLYEWLLEPLYSLSGRL